MEAVKRAMDAQSTYPYPSAKILGVHLEGPFLNRRKAGALKKEFFLDPNETTFEELTDGFKDIIKIVTIAPELKGAQSLIRKMAKMGILVSMGHSEATYLEAEEAYKNGARCITHIFNAMRAFHHREVGIAGFGLLKDEVFVEIIGDLEHLDIKTIELIFRLKDKNHIILVSDSTKETLLEKNKKGKLKGGKKPLKTCVEMLINFGFAKDIVVGCVTTNPMRFLSLAG